MDNNISQTCVAPWALYNLDDRTYSISDGSTGIAWECVPPPEVTPRIELLLNSFGHLCFSHPDARVMVQFVLLADHDVSEFVDAYRRTKTDEAGKRYAEAQLAAIRDVRPPPCNFRLFVFARFTDPDAQLRTENITAIRACLGGAGLYPSPLNAEALGQALAPIVGTLFFPESVVTLNAQPVRRQGLLRLVGGGAAEKHGTFPMGNRYLAPLVAVSRTTAFSHQPFAGMLPGALFGEEGCGYADRPFALVGTLMREPLQPAGRRQADVTALSTLWLWDDDASRLTEAATRAKRYLTVRGYEVKTGIGMEMLPTLLPFASFEQVLRKHGRAIDKDDIAKNLPLHTDGSIQFGYPRLLHVGAKGQLCALDLFDKLANNNNLLITGGGREERTRVATNVLSEYAGSGCSVFVVERGAALAGAINAFGGKMLAADVFFDPFSLVHYSTNSADCEAALTLVTGLCGASTGVLPDGWQAVLRRTFRAFCDKHIPHETGNWGRPTMRRFCDFLAQEGKRAKSEFGPDVAKIHQGLCHKLLQLCSKESDGVDSLPQLVANAGAAHFNLEQSGNTQVYAVLSVCGRLILESYFGDRSKRRLFVFHADEELLTMGGAVQDAIEELLRRARSYGVAVVFVAERLDRLADTRIGNVIFCNTQFGMHLTQRVENRTMFGDLAKAVSAMNTQGRQGEMTVQTPDGYGYAKLPSNAMLDEVLKPREQSTATAS